jgi:acetyl-CoA synthetase
MTWYLDFEGTSYEEARANFEWDLPAEYNVALDCVRKHDPDEDALFHEHPGGRRETLTFGDLDDWSDRLASGLSALGLDRGDRVAVLLGQRPETAVSHLACSKLGLVSVPLSVLFGEGALRHRLRDSGARVVVADAGVADVVAAVEDACPDLERVFTVGDAGSDREYESLDSVWRDEPPGFDAVSTRPDDTAVVVYTSGTTGPPKGVAHAQAVWVSYCSAFRMYFEHVDARPERSVYWTPSDWAWIGGLGTVLFPAWHYGRPVVSRPMRRFDASTAYGVMERFGVTHASIPPTALRMLAGADASPSAYDLSLSVLVSGSEPLTEDVVAWVDEAFESVVVNEGYGQTETGNTVSNCHAWFDLRPGSMGKPVPGYDVAVVDAETRERVPPNALGEVAVRRTGNPGVFEEYFGSTGGETDGEWHFTGDLARRDESGYLWFVGRTDDLIVTSGYRVAPRDVEQALREHDAVAAAGVVGAPDDERGERIVAFVQLRDDREASAALREELRDRVREDFARYAYPRTLTFVDSLPTTRTGKVDTGRLRDRARDGAE